MSGETKLVHEGRFVRLVFSDGLSINWAPHERPDGTMVTVEDQTASYADGFRTRMEKLAAALEPLLMEMAVAQGGTLMAKEDHPNAHRIAVNLTTAAGMSVGISSLSLHVGMPSSLTDEQREQVLACTTEVWGGKPKPVNRDPGIPPWQAFPHLGPSSVGWRMGEAEQFRERWSATYSRMFANMCDDYQAKYPAPFYWFWIYWGPNEFRTWFIPVLAIITLPWRWWDHRAHRRRASAPPAP